VTARHVAGRRRTFATRQRQLDERERERTEPRRISYKVPGATSDQAIATAKAEAKSEGWTLRTVAGCRPAADAGLWVVTLVGVRTWA
jgi:hypothetical protein